MRILIITGGRIDRDFALSFLKKEDFECTIVVDGALAFWDEVETYDEIRFHLDYLVGDFDTISPEILKNYINRGDIEIRRFNPEKDNTDTEIAVALALDLIVNKADSSNGESGGSGEPEIVLLGATGTRADHMLANLQLLEQARVVGVPCEIIDSNNRIRLIESRFVLHQSEQFGHYVSLIPVTELLEGVKLKGFKYPLNGRTVHMGESLCVSNELIDDEGEIEIKKGRALLIESRD